MIEHLPPEILGLGRKRSKGSTFSELMYTLSPGLNDVAGTPAESNIVTEKYTSVIGPRISSSLPIWIGAKDIQDKKKTGEERIIP
jgi:hypothetical protein